MQPIRSILVGIDDSPSSDAALTQAIAIAQAAGATLVLAHVTSFAGEGLANDEHRPHRVPDAGTSVLGEAVARAREAGVAATAELLLGYPPRQLVLLADELDADLIVVGARSLSGMQRAVLGSASHDIVKHTSRPVLVVPATGAKAA